MQARNGAEASVHQIRKALSEHGAALDQGEKDAIEAAIKDLEEAVKGESKDEIESKTTALMTASQKLGEKMYAQAQGGAAEAAAAAAGAGAGAGSSEQKAAKNDDVVDADFKEVKRG